jgi:hypothetical protein
MGFDFLDDFVDESLSKKPSAYETALYLFWDKGIGYEDFKKYPIPYIIAIIKTHNWVKSEEEKAYKKANKKR